MRRIEVRKKRSTVLHQSLRHHRRPGHRIVWLFAVRHVANNALGTWPPKAVMAREIIVPVDHPGTSFHPIALVMCPFASVDELASLHNMATSVENVTASVQK